MGDSQVARGACLCGAVRFQVTLPTMFCGHCHCTVCQRAHGAGYVTWFGAGYSHFELLDETQQLKRYASSEHGTRSFCGTCGSSLFCESTEHPEHIDIVLANMQDPIDRKPNSHAYFDCRADWIIAEDSLVRLGGKTGLEKLPRESSESG
jgi:hypothetical protein